MIATAIYFGILLTLEMVYPDYRIGNSGFYALIGAVILLTDLLLIIKKISAEK